MADDKVIIDLGEKKGPLLFFGGVYSNLQALTALQNWAEKNHFVSDNIFCTGDITGYCAQPIECIKLIKSWNIHSVAGNVELQLSNNEDDCGCNFIENGRCDIFSKNWYNYTRSKIDESSQQWLANLPHHFQFTYGKNKVTIVHGSWFHTAEFIFKSTPWQTKQKNFDVTGSEIIIAGHSGIPFLDRQSKYSWINPGVIGMPANDGSNKVWFATAVIENEEISFTFHQLEYDYGAAREMMIANKLPLSYANTLQSGIWDNCEILPAEEKNQQGLVIIL